MRGYSDTDDGDESRRGTESCRVEKNKVQTVKKSLEVQQTVQQYQAAEEARAIAAKEAVESKGRRSRS